MGVFDQLKKCIGLTNLRPDSDPLKPARIHFHLKRGLFTAKRPFDLPVEYETGFTVYMNLDSITKQPPPSMCVLFTVCRVSMKQRYSNTTVFYAMSTHFKSSVVALFATSNWQTSLRASEVHLVVRSDCEQHVKNKTRSGTDQINIYCEAGGLG